MSITNGTADSRPRRGYLGHRQPDRKRARMAVKHYEEGRPLEHPTLAQLSFAYRCRLSDVLNARRAGNGHSKTERNGHSKTLAEHLASASLSERIAAAKALGVDVVWDTMVLPLVGNGKTSE
jgi:hypothetical protein